MLELYLKLEIVTCWSTLYSVAGIHAESNQTAVWMPD